VRRLSKYINNIPTFNPKLVKRKKSGCPGGNLNPYSVELRRMSALDASPDPQSSKVGKTEKRALLPE